ncbi:MAG: hypothetical protein ACPGPG_11370, partial [Luminiphilus sp.]
MFTSLLGVAQASDSAELDVPQVFLRGIPYDITLNLENASGALPVLAVGEQLYPAEASDQGLVYRNVVAGSESKLLLSARTAAGTLTAAEVPVIPAWISILPPLLAIGM